MLPPKTLGSLCPRHMTWRGSNGPCWVSRARTVRRSCGMLSLHYLTGIEQTLASRATYAALACFTWCPFINMDPQYTEAMHVACLGRRKEDFSILKQMHFSERTWPQAHPKRLTRAVINSLKTQMRGKCRPSGVHKVVAPYDSRPLWSTFLDWRNRAIQTQPVPEPTGDSLT